MPTVCSICGKEATLNASNYCQACNGFKARIQRQLKSLDNQDPQIGKDFINLSKSERAAFYTQHHEMHGKDLAMKTLQSTSEARTKRYSVKFAAEGKGMDAADIKEKYKNKDPQIAANIFEMPFLSNVRSQSGRCGSIPDIR